MNGRSKKSAVTNTAVSGLVVFLLASGSVWAQASTIPGVGGGVPPKVLIIFDTSTSMRNLPETDIPNTPSFPVSPTRGDRKYAFDDFNPATNGSPDGGCENRFCIAKRVLYNTMPTYSDSIQMGMASYFQYRTEWAQPLGSTRCAYDVLSNAGRNTKFTSPTATWAGTSMPPTNSARCDNIAVNKYPITLFGTDGGSPVTCSAYRPLPDAGPWATGSTACLSASNFVSTTNFDLYNGGASAATSNIWVQMPKSATSCPSGNVMWGGGTSYQGGSVPSSSLAGGIARVLSYATMPMPGFAPLVTGWSGSCTTGLGACQLTLTGAMMDGPVTETTQIILWADAGSPLDGGFGNISPFTLVSYGGTSRYAYAIDAGMTCRWLDDSTTAVLNASKVVANLNGYSRVSGNTAACSGVAPSSLSVGCRVFSRDAGTQSFGGTWSPTFPTSTQYSWSAPSNFSSTCSNPSTGTVSTAFSALSDLTLTVPKATSPASCGDMNVADAGGSGACSASFPCDYRSGVTGTSSADPGGPVYKPYVDAGVYTLVSGYPTTSTIYRARAGYATACPTTDITDILPCTAGKPCAVTSLGVDAGGTNAPTDQFWYSSTIPAYAVDGGVAMAGDPVYSYIGTVSTLPIPLTTYGPEKTSPTCTATVSLTSGVTLSGANGACSATRPCTLTNIADICKSISTDAVVPCSSGTDSTQVRSCAYQSVKTRYSATPFGSCAYSIKQYRYEQATCRYTVHRWRLTAPACNENRTVCNFDTQEVNYTYYNPFKYCRATGTNYNYAGTTPLQYIYQWNTKGGEYLGTFTYTNTKLTARNYCELPVATYVANISAAPDCPSEINSTNRASFTSGGYENTLCGVGGVICRLRWRSTHDAGVSGTFAGRLDYVTAPSNTDPTFEVVNVNNVRCETPDRDGGELLTPPNANWIPVAASTQADWCYGTGSNGVAKVRLMSDWYEPARSNPAPTVALPFADTWTNQPMKLSGWSSNQYDGGASQLFVGMDFGSNNISTIKNALTACVRPTNTTSPMSGGFCMSDDDNCGPADNEQCQARDAGMTDFTPLNGSLRNATDYMRDQLRFDNADVTCRDYYVVLVTDGLESTPANYSQSDLVTTVNALTNLTSTSPARSKKVKTFVIGFGAGLAAADGGANSLDVIARQGETAVVISSGNVVYDFVNGKALSASNEAELANVLGIVFSSITQGRFARSRPTITSDGVRIYQAYFDRGITGALDAGTPEWRGNLEAFQIDVSGTLFSKWEFRPKVDAQTIASRNLKAEMPLPDGGINLQAFTVANVAALGGLTAATVRFVRNDTLGAHVDETFSPIAIPRTSRAGAFVFSNPVAVGAPVFNSATYAGLAGEAAVGSYNTFKATWEYRPTRVIIGGEDGFLRGIVDNPKGSFNAGCTAADESTNACPNGTEAWGLVPSSIVSKLAMTRLSPQLLVDGTAAIADVCWPASGNNAADCGAGDWRTVAIGSLRAGGQSVTGYGIDSNNSEYFALDVTDAGFPTPLWRYDDKFDNDATDDLGLTYSTPTIGRVSIGSGAGEKHWVAFAGGGKCSSSAGFDAGVDTEGDGIYILDMKTGKTLLSSGFITKYTAGGACANFVARPSVYRRMGKIDVESVYYGNEQGRIYAQRTWQTNTASNWAPGIWYDGWDVMSQPDTQLNTRAPIWYLVKTTAGSFTAGTRVATGCRMQLGSTGAFNSLPASAGSPVNCTSLATRRPIFGRPRVAYANDTSLTNPDLFFGTGDQQALDNTSSRDFFFAVFDERFNDQAYMSTSTQKGKTSWVFMFDPGEKVLGEPVMSSGSIVVATYAPPTSGSTCGQLGDSYLYAFDPRTGEPRATLRDPNVVGTPTYTPVVKLTGVGAISDPIVINGGLYYADGTGQVSKVETRPVGLGGRIQGWRRVR